MQLNDTIVAIATPQGMGAIAVVRISGPEAFSVLKSVFFPKKQQDSFQSHKVYLGDLKNGETVLDEVLVTIFKEPHSYTGENVVEISCHGSTYIQQELLKLLVKQGCRLAEPGEFTMRAFLNKKLDLSQTEAVCDLISSKNQAAQQLALKQLKGGVSKDIAHLRTQLIDFAALIELELDFSEEEVEFADQDQFKNLILQIQHHIQKLLESFTLGNAIKEGIPIIIMGKPNAGKSTLLNALLNEEKALVSDIPGTTRDTIEDVLTIRDLQFRVIDTAGIRETKDQIEQMGVERAFEKGKSAQMILHLIDTQDWLTDPQPYKQAYQNLQEKYPNKPIVQVLTKQDLLNKSSYEGYLSLSALTGEGLQMLKDHIYNHFDTKKIKDETVITNVRHYESLLKSKEFIDLIYSNLEKNIPKDLLTSDLREAIRLLGTVTGEVDLDKDILGAIFSRFCIGK